MAARVMSRCVGETDGPGGWRANKATGGIVMDVVSGEVPCGVCAIDLTSGKWSRSCDSRPPCKRSSP